MHEQIKATSYPALNRNGIICAYMGSGEPPADSYGKQFRDKAGNTNVSMTKLLRDQRLKEHRLPDYAPLKNARNNYGYGPEKQARKTDTCMGLDINVHDQWAVESIGAIQDRTIDAVKAGKTDALPMHTGIRSGPMQGANDVMLVPDPTTFRVLPWASHSARLICDVVFRDGTEIPFSSRTVLQNSVDQLADHGFVANMGLEVEFHALRRWPTRVCSFGSMHKWSFRHSGN